MTKPSKRCTRCGEVKPRSGFHKDKRRRDGLYSWCKMCFNAHVLAMRDPVVEAARGAAYRATPEGHAKAKARVKAWREANPERWAAWCAQDSARAVENARQWALANPERASLNSRRAANKRRARKRDQSAGPIDYAAVLAEHGMICHICTEDIPSLDVLHFDHVIPLSKGGPHIAENIRPSHALCNLRKGARLIA